MDSSDSSDQHRSKLSWFALQCSVVGVSGFVIFCVLILMRHIWNNPEWLISIFEEHFLSTVGAPLAMVAALVIVTLFRYQAGPIEFKALGFKFRGAAGPTILWVIIFLTMIIAIKFLWE